MFEFKAMDFAEKEEAAQRMKLLLKEGGTAAKADDAQQSRKRKADVSIFTVSYVLLIYQRTIFDVGFTIDDTNIIFTSAATATHIPRRMLD